MPDLPAAGDWQVQDYSGMGGVRWKPPIDTVQLRTGAAGKYCLTRNPGHTSRSDITVMAPGKFSADYSLGDKRGTFEAELQNDGSLKITFLGQNFRGAGDARDGAVTVRGIPVTEKPSLADKLKFCPAVLRNPDFQKSGILFGDDPSLVRSCQWVVIDPNRFKMTVWEKTYPTQDFPSAARGLNASVFTNGPYFLYTPGQHDSLPEHIARGYYKENRLIRDDLSAVMRVVGIPEKASDVAAAGVTVYNISRDGLNWTARIAKKVFGSDDSTTRMVNVADKTAPQRVNTWSSMKAWEGGGPCGYVLGNNGAIQIKRPAAHLAYFGRKQGTDFGSYSIGNGNPEGFAEAIGALQLAAKDYKATDVELNSGPNQWFYWALVPFSGGGSPLPGSADLKDALAAYSRAAPGGGAVDGLIVGVYYHGSSHIQLLLDIGAKDIARLDGSDSVLFGHHDTLLVGDSMSESKRIAQGWGFAFYPK